MNIQTGVHEKGAFTLVDVLENVKNRAKFKKAGAIALFVGVVREETPKSEKVQKLELEAYEDKANEVLASICKDLKKKQGIIDVQIHHFLGEFNVGEELVYVLVTGAHRKDVFPVLEKAVERYKKEALIFKKEYTTTKKGKIRAYWVTEKENH